MNMYMDMSEEGSPSSPGRSKRRHRETSEAKETKKAESSSPTKTSFLKFLKKKKSETKTNVSSFSTSSAHSGGKEGARTDMENSMNHRAETEMDIGRLNADSAGAAASFQPRGEQVTTKTARKSVDTLEAKSSSLTAASQNGIGAAPPRFEVSGASAALSDSNNNSASVKIAAAEPTASSSKSSDAKAEKSAAGKAESKKRVHDDKKKELVVHSLPKYNPADVDLTASPVHDKTVRAKFESMLGPADSGSSGFNSPLSGPGSVNQQKRTHAGRVADSSSLAVETSEPGSAASTLTRQRRQQEQNDELVSSTAAMDRMAEMQSVLTPGRVPNVIHQMSSEPPPADGSRASSIEDREYSFNDDTDHLSLQEDFVIEATTYYGQNELLTPPSTKTAAQQGHRKYPGSEEEHRSAPTTVIVQENKDATAKVGSAQASGGPVSNGKTRTGSEVEKSQHHSNRTEQCRTTTSATTNAIKEQQDVAVKAKTAQSAAPENSRSTEKNATSARDRPNTSGKTDRSDYDTKDERRQRVLEARAVTDKGLKDNDARQQDSVVKKHAKAVHREASARPEARPGDVENERRAQRTRVEPEEDRDSTPTPIEPRDQDKPRSTKIFGRKRSASPGAHGFDSGSNDAGQRFSDQSDDTESVSEVEQRQHHLKAMTQAELLEQAKRRPFTTADTATGDHNARMPAKSTYAATISTHGINVERVPSKASLDQMQEDARKDRTDEKQRRSFGGRVEHHQFDIEGEINGPIKLEWGNPRGQDSPELRTHIRPRQHHAPARSHSNASSDISSSMSSQSSAAARGREPRRRGSHSSSDATPTEADNAQPHRSRRPAPTSREPIRRSASLPMSDDISDDNIGRERDYHIAPVMESHQATQRIYAGRTSVPVSGRQKIKRTTETPAYDDEVAMNSEPRSAYIYVDDSNVGDVRQRARKLKSAASGRPRLSHSVDNRFRSRSPDEVPVRTGKACAGRGAPVDDEEYDDDPAVAVRHHPQRQVPTGRTKKIQRRPDVDDGRIISSSPESARRARSPTSTDGTLYQLYQPHVDPRVRYTRRAPTGRTKGIHHGSNVDISIVDDSTTPGVTADGVKSPTSTSDWLRRQRSGLLTVDVVGKDGHSSNLNRAYRSMPDLMDDDQYTDEIAPKKASRNQSGYNELDGVDQSGYQPSRSSNPRGRSGGRVTATIRDTILQPEQAETSVLSSSVADRRGDGVGRMRGVVSGATVENRGGRGHRSGRTTDMPLTDVEDYDDYAGWRKTSGGHVARVYVGGDDDDVAWESQDDTMSVFSEPPQRGRSRTSVLSQSVAPHRPSAILTPANRPSPMPPHVPVPQGAFELTHVDTHISQQMSPELGSPEATISAVDPALRGASKQGTNYHITLTLKPTITAVSPRPGGTVSRSQMTTSAQRTMTSAAVENQYPTFPSQTPRAVSSLAVFNDDPVPTTSQPYETLSPRRPVTLTTRPGRGTSTTIPASRRRSRSRSSTRPSDGQIGFNVELRSMSDDDHTLQKSTSQRQTNVTEYQLGPQISSTVEFTYSPPADDDGPMDYRQRHQNEAAPASHIGRPRRPQDDDDEMTRPHRAPRHQQPQNQSVPEIQRRNFLIKNAIDTSKPPKVCIF